MAVLTLDPRKALQPQFIEGVINKKLEQNLDFLDIFPEVQTDAVGFTFMKDTTNAGADIASGKMGTPVELGELSELTEIEVSPINLQYGQMNRFGYQMRFSKRSLREQAFIDEIARAMDRMAFGMAKKMNDDVIDILKANVNEITEQNGAAVWSDAAATPVEDLLTFAQAMQVEGYPYELTDLYVHKTNYFEMMKYLQGIDINWVVSPVGGARKVPEVNGVQLHDLHSTQLAEGSYVGLDKRYPACTIYKYLDPDHSTMEGGRINVNKYEEDKYPYNIVVEVYAERGIALKLPNAACYKASAI